MKRFDIKKSILKNKKAVVIVVISAFVIGGGVIFVKGKIVGNKQEIAFEDFQETVQLEKGDLNESIIVSGNVKSGEVSNVSSTITAKVKAVNVKVGDIVKVGDVICILDDSDIVKEIENKKKAISEEKQVLQENYNKLLSQLNTLKSTQSQNNQNLSKAIELAKSNLDKLNLELSNSEATLNNIVVKKSCRGRGIGGELLESLIDLCGDLHMRTFTLEVDTENAPAIHLYEKFGFKNLGIRKKYYNGSRDAYIMTKSDF